MGLFRPWGLEHSAILAAVVALPAALGIGARGSVGRTALVARVFGFVLIGNELIWWVFRYREEGLGVHNLPLQLCDLSVWVAAAASLFRRQFCFEFAYFAGLAGGGMALLTPDLWAPWPSYPSAYYFLSHGLTVTTVLFLVWGAGMRPTSWALGRFLLAANAYAVLVGLVNAAFQTNYLYLCRKPEAPTILDHLGPWPWYLVFGEAIAAALCLLLWLPFSPWLRSRLAGLTGA